MAMRWCSSSRLGKQVKVFVNAVPAFSAVARHVVRGSNRLVRSTTRAGGAGLLVRGVGVIAPASVTCRVPRV
jgi:hypothetical protein